jgi:hypothetical protein
VQGDAQMSVFGVTYIVYEPPKPSPRMSAEEYEARLRIMGIIK